MPFKGPFTLSVNPAAPEQFRVETQLWSESLGVSTEASWLMFWSILMVKIVSVHY